MQIEECKRRRAIAWQQQARDEFLLEQLGAVFGASTNTVEQESKLEKWAHTLDYLSYAEDWMGFCSAKGG